MAIHSNHCRWILALCLAALLFGALAGMIELAEVVLAVVILGILTEVSSVSILEQPAQLESGFVEVRGGRPRLAQSSPRPLEIHKQIQRTLFMRNQVRKLMLIAAIALAMLAGAPLRPDQIEDLLHQLSQPKVAHVLRQEKEDPDHDHGSREGSTTPQ